MTTTAEQIIDRASGQHFSFRSNLNEGMALAQLNETQRAFLLALAKTLENQVGTTEDILTGLEGAALVALDENSVPYFTDTITPGFAIRFSGGVPYIEAANPIIVDPFGTDGDTPGLPLPDDLLRLIWITARTATIVAPAPPIVVEIVKQEVVKKNAPRTGLQAFLSANRIVPVRQAQADLWSQVTSLQLGCIVSPTMTVLTDELSVPDAMTPALTAALAKWMAMQSKECPADARRQFAVDAESKYQEVFMLVNAMDAVTTSSIIYRR